MNQDPFKRELFNQWQKARAGRIGQANRRRTVHYFQYAANRLFVCHSADQSDELRRLCGNAIHRVSETWVRFRRIRCPFADEIDLKAGLLAQ